MAPAAKPTAQLSAEQKHAEAFVHELVRQARARVTREEAREEGRTTAACKHVLAALYSEGAGFNTAAVRERHGDAWPHITAALVTAIDVHQNKAAEEAELVTDVYKMLNAPAPRVSCNLLSAHSVLGFTDSLMGFFQGSLPPEVFNSLRGRLAPLQPAQASPHRPPLASRVARFDPGYELTTPQGVTSPAVREARAEVQTTHLPSEGNLHVAGDTCFFGGAGGYKQRDPYLERYMLSAEEGLDSGDHTQGGFYEPVCAVFVDAQRKLNWAMGDRRIKAFDVDGKCVHTLHMGNGGGGPLVVLGDRLLGPGSKHGAAVQAWNMGALPRQQKEFGVEELPEEGADGADSPRAEDGTRLIDLRDGSWMDEFGMEQVEVTKGEGAHEEFRFEHITGNVNLIHPLASNYEAPAQVIVGVGHGSCLWVHDWPSRTLAALLVGHEGPVLGVSTTPELPDWVLSCSNDGTSRLWDVRAGGGSNVLTMDNNDSGSVSACALVADGGGAYAFTSTFSESILCWDLRMQRPLYELSTGNSRVASLQWDPATRSLLASTEYSYMDRLGYCHDQGEVQGYVWPKCHHKPRDFPLAWDVREHCVIRYHFKDDPDADQVPVEAEPGEQYSEGEEWKPSNRDPYAFF